MLRSGGPVETSTSWRRNLFSLVRPVQWNKEKLNYLPVFIYLFFINLGSWTSITCFLDFRCPNSMPVHPSMHLSVCKSSWSSSSSLPCWRSAPVTASLLHPPCDVQHLFILHKQWLLPLFPSSVASLVTFHLSAYFAIFPHHHTCIHPSLHTSVLPQNPARGKSCPSLCRQPLVLEVKGEWCKCQLFVVLYHFSNPSVLLTCWGKMFV